MKFHNKTLWQLAKDKPLSQHHYARVSRAVWRWEFSKLNGSVFFHPLGKRKWAIPSDSDMVRMKYITRKRGLFCQNS